MPPGASGGMKRAAALLLPLIAQPAVAEPCLTADQARVEAAGRQLMVFPEAVQAARRRYPGEPVSANLCRIDGRLMYVLAILAKDGRVVRALVDPETAAVRQLP